MALFDAKCPNCNATLKVDGGLDTANCEFCGSAFIVEKAVQNFYVNIQAQNVIVQGGVKEDFEIRGGVLVKYSGSDIEVVVPEGVVEIGGFLDGTFCGAFERLKITKVLLPQSLRIIGHRAFNNCVLLKTILLPDGLAEIQNGAFAGCSALESINIPDSVNIHLQKDYEHDRDCGCGVFFGCTKLRNVSISPSCAERIKWWFVFQGTPYGRNEFISRGLCTRCGGKFTLFGNCKKCLERKDY